MKYLCYAVVTGTKYLGTVEAETEQEAADKAVELPTASVALCHQCVRECSDPEIQEIEVEEEEGAL